MAPLWQYLLKHKGSKYCYTHREQLHTSVQWQVWVLPCGGRSIRPIAFTHTARLQLLLLPKATQGSASLLGTLQHQRGKSLLVSKHSCCLLHFLLREETSCSNGETLQTQQPPEDRIHPCFVENHENVPQRSLKLLHHSSVR